MITPSLIVGGNFKEGFTRFRSEKTFIDLIIRVNGRNYYAHKMIVSYSSNWFSEQFKKKKKNSSSSNDSFTSSQEQCFDKLLPATVIELELGESESQVFEDVLGFLYSGNIKITLLNVVPISKISQILGISKLSNAVDRFLQNNINKQTAPDLLTKAIEFNMKPIIDHCIGVFAKNFAQLKNENYNFRQLPLTIMVQLLDHRELCADSEADINETIQNYLEQFPSTDAESHYKLFSTAMHGRQMNSPLQQWPSAYRRIFEYTSDFDKNGILYFISTNGGRSEWQNPAKTGEVKVSLSSSVKGKPELICELDPQECWSDDVPASWFCIDFGKERAVKPTRYTLRHGGVIFSVKSFL
jgi:hypothetical protein